MTEARIDFDKYVASTRYTLEDQLAVNQRRSKGKASLFVGAIDAFERLLTAGVITPENRFLIRSELDSLVLTEFEQVHRNLSRSAKELLADDTIDRGLIIIPTTRCCNGCVHCLTEAQPSGSDMNLTDLTSVDSRFWDAFRFVHMSPESDVLEYGDQLPDLVAHLADSGIEKMGFDVRMYRDESSKLMFEQILARLRDQGVETTLRISFDFFPPDIYKDPDNPELERRFMEVMNTGLTFTDKIIVNVCGSYKYSRAHIFKTNRYLHNILLSNGFSTPFPVHFLRAEDPEAALDALRTRSTAGGDTMMFKIKRMLGDLGVFPEHALVPSYVHDESGREIEMRYLGALNMGRWAKVEDKGVVQNPLEAYLSRMKVERRICGVTTSDRFSLYPGGEVAACNGSYSRNVCFVNVFDDGYDGFVEGYQRVLDDQNAFLERNLPAIMTGETNSWLCRRPDASGIVFKYEE